MRDVSELLLSPETHCSVNPDTLGSHVVNSYLDAIQIKNHRICLAAKSCIGRQKKTKLKFILGKPILTVGELNSSVILNLQSTNYCSIPRWLRFRLFLDDLDGVTLTCTIFHLFQNIPTKSIWLLDVLNRITFFFIRFYPVLQSLPSVHQSAIT